MLRQLDEAVSAKVRAAHKSGEEIRLEPEELHQIHAHTPPTKAIRAKCLECCGNSRKQVALCTSVGCPLWPLRFGVNPYDRRSRGMARLVVETGLTAKESDEVRPDDGE